MNTKQESPALLSKTILKTIFGGPNKICPDCPKHGGCVWHYDAYGDWVCGY